MLKGILISVLVIVACAGIQMVVTHFFRLRRTFNVLAGLFLLSLPAYGWLYLKMPADLYFLSESFTHASPSLGFVGGLLLHWLLYCNYTQCYYYLTTPVTLRILLEFLMARDKTLTICQLNETYGLRQMIGGRLEILSMNGYVQTDGNRYVLTSKGKLLASALGFLRYLFGVPYYLELE